ncbi:MAG: leucine-rich repeat domain-containing protein [Oscillospiraceae bacterium]|nr:leucine-rich repeat domain-containing protein [Oscillospiraceae bacterium]
MNEFLKSFLEELKLFNAKMQSLSDKSEKQEPEKKQELIPQNSPEQEFLPKELVYIPDLTEFQSIEVPALHITSKQAIQQGFSFRKKSKSIRITNYHGTSENLMIPAFIDNLKVNEIGQNAFYQNKIIKKIQIPSTIRKIGKNAFREMQLQTCIFADGLQAIPEMCFFDCQELTEIHLPKTLQSIGSRAMAYCKKLNYIQFPPNIWKLEDYAFFDTGLKGFGTSNRYATIRNGLAFESTPLQNNYALILGKKLPYDYIPILLVGNKTRDFSFLENKSINLLKNSVLCFHLLYYHSLTLDFHKCRSVSLTRDSFWIRYDKNGVPQNSVFVIFPKSVSRYQFHKLPAGVSGYFITKEQPIENFHYQIINHNLIIVKPKILAISGNYETYIGEICCSGYQTLKIEKERNLRHTIHENAIRTFDIQEIELGEFQATGAIFSGLCFSLHKISWLEQQEMIIKYIPCTELVGEWVHKALLKAFAPVENKFFNSKLLETIFLQNPYVHTRQRVFIAIDMLKSTQRLCDSSIAIYQNYLKNHMRQAEKFCYAIQDKYPEYLAFLEKFKT